MISCSVLPSRTWIRRSVSTKSLASSLASSTPIVEAVAAARRRVPRRLLRALHRQRDAGGKNRIEEARGVADHEVAVALDREVERRCAKGGAQMIAELFLVDRACRDKGNIGRHGAVQPLYIGGLRQRGAGARDQVIGKARVGGGNEGCDMSHWRALR